MIYSYSHQRFNEFIAIPEVASIIKIIVTSVGVDKVIEHNQTLAIPNPERYRAHMIEMAERL